MDTNDRIIAVAFSQVGVEETVGTNHTSRVLQYFEEIGHKWVKDDETPWCAAFANWCCKKAMVEDTGKLNARSFLDIGQAIDLKDAEHGDVVILWRGSKTSAQGHVAFYVDQDASKVCLIGGNQDNSVCLGMYDKSRVLGVRRLQSKFASTEAQDA